MRYIIILLTLAGFGLAPSAIAQIPGAGPPQGRITGTVIDAESGEPIGTATVGIWREADSTLATGAVTRPDGGFDIQGLPDGAYWARISFVGFASQTISGIVIGPDSRNADLGTIELQADTQMLDEVEIAAERAQMQIQIDRTVFNVADAPVAIGGTATNVLETIPSIDVDVDGNVSLRGSGNVAVLINGRPAPVGNEYIAMYLRQLPAGSIDRVEVIPNPSARYEPDGMAGIINIVLKEEAELGLGGTVVAGGDTRGGYNASGTFTYGRGPLNMALTYGFRQDEGSGGGESFRINKYVTPWTYFDQFEEDDESQTSHFVSLSSDLQLSRKTVVNASAQAGFRNETEKELTDFFELDDQRDPLSQLRREMLEDGNGWNADFRVGITHNFAGMSTGRAGGGAPGGGGFRGRWGGGMRGGGPGGPSGGSGHTLSIEARFDASANEGDELFTELDAGTNDMHRRQNAFTDRNNQEASLQVDYVRPIGAFRLEAGYKGDLEMMYSDLYSESAMGSGPLQPDEGLINTFDYDQQIHAVYLQLARQFGNIGTQVGLRGETANTTFTLRNTDENFDNDYASLFPSAFLTYSPAQGTTFRASYSRRIMRPWTFFLNPFPSYDDPLNIRTGNPSLKPQYIDAFELGYIQFTPWGSVTFSPFYRRTTNVIRFYQELREDGVTVRRPDNFDTSSSSGVELITSLDAGALLPGLRGYVSMEGFRMVTDGSNVDAALQNNAFGWGGRANVTYNLGNMFGLGDLDLQATLRYRAPMETEQGRVGSFSWTDLALRQELFNDRASLTIRARDALGTAGFHNIIDQENIYSEFSREFGARALGFTFTYSFGEQRQQPQRPRPDDGPPEGFDQMPMD